MMPTTQYLNAAISSVLQIKPLGSELVQTWWSRVSKLIMEKNNLINIFLWNH